MGGCLFFFRGNALTRGGDPLAKPNYQFKKRQKELARKLKKEQKRQDKIDKKTGDSEESSQQDSDGGTNPLGMQRVGKGI